MNSLGTYKYIGCRHVRNTRERDSRIGPSPSHLSAFRPHPAHRIAHILRYIRTVASHTTPHLARTARRCRELASDEREGAGAGSGARPPLRTLSHTQHGTGRRLSCVHYMEPPTNVTEVVSNAPWFNSARAVSPARWVPGPEGAMHLPDGDIAREKRCLHWQRSSSCSQRSPRGSRHRRCTPRHPHRPAPSS